jgi:hypothetical protein
MNKSVRTKKRRMPAQAFVAETNVKASENPRVADGEIERMHEQEQGQNEGMARKFVAPLEGR